MSLEIIFRKMTSASFEYFEREEYFAQHTIFHCCPVHPDDRSLGGLPQFVRDQFVEI